MNSVIYARPLRQFVPMEERAALTTKLQVIFILGANSEERVLDVEHSKMERQKQTPH